MARILVVDDDAGVLQMIKLMIEDADHDCIACSSVDKGLAELKSGTVDLVLTDIVMPDREGIEFIREIRDAEPNLPIVAMSGSRIGYDVLTMAEHLGATATIPKPFRRQELLDLLGKLLPR